MEFEEIVLLLVSGGVAGWLAGLILKKGGLGITTGNIIVGVIGVFIGSSLFRILRIRFGNPAVGSLVTAAVGAVILFTVIGLIQKNKG